MSSKSVRIKHPSLELNWLPNSLRKTLPTPTILIVDDKRFGGRFTPSRHPVIEIAQNSLDDFESTLAHEYRHLWQLFNGKLGRNWFTADMFTCHDTYKSTILAYFTTQPWEMDALAFQRRVAPNTELTELWWEWLDERAPHKKMDQYGC